MLNNRMIALFDLRCYRKNGDDQYWSSPLIYNLLLPVNTLVLSVLRRKVTSDDKKRKNLV